MGTLGQRGHSVAGMSRACSFDKGSIQMSASRKRELCCDGANQKGPFCGDGAAQALDLRTTLLMSLLMNHQDDSNPLMRSFTQKLRCVDKEFRIAHSKRGVNVISEYFPLIPCLSDLKYTGRVLIQNEDPHCVSGMCV